MKTYLTLLVLFVACTLFGQVDQTRYTLVYSLHQSDAGGRGPGRYFDPALAHSVFGTAELPTKRLSRFTIGAGFLQSRMKHSDLHPVTYENIEQHFNLDFVAISTGIKFAFGSFFIHPEIAATYDYSIAVNSYFLDSEMNIADEPYDSDILGGGPFEIQFASLLNMGYQIKSGSVSGLLGVKGYYALTNNYVNTFGVGLMIGLKI